MSRTRLPLFVLSVSLIVAASYLAANFFPQPARLISLGLEAPVQRTLTAAEQVPFWTARVDRDPRDYISRAYLGYAYMLLARESGDPTLYGQAETVLRQALAINSDDETALAFLAAAQLNQHSFQEALESARRVYAFDSGALQALATIGDASLELGDYQGAEEAYLELLDANPSPPVYSRMARLTWMQGRSEQAMDWMRRAAEEALALGQTGEGPAWYQFAVGDFYFDEGMLDEAEQYFEISLSLFDGYYLALAGLGEVAAARGDYEAAIVHYEAALAASPQQPGFLSSLGYLYELTGRSEEAQELYDRSVAISTSSEFHRRIYNRELVNFFANSDIRLDEALRLAEWEISIRRDVHGYDALAWALYKNGRHSDAGEAIEKALALGTRDANLYFHAGMIYAALGENDRALAMLTEAFAINPYFDLYQASIGMQTLERLHSEG